MPNQEHAPEPETEQGDLMAVVDADALERNLSNWVATMDEMVWDVQAMNARLLGTPDPALDIQSLLARLPGTQAHEHAENIVSEIGDSAAPSDQEASLPEAAPPEPSEDRQDKLSSNSAYARRVTLQEGDVEIYSDAQSDTGDYAPQYVGYVYESVRGPHAIAGTRLALERTPPRMGQAEP